LLFLPACKRIHFHGAKQSSTDRHRISFGHEALADNGIKLSPLTPTFGSVAHPLTSRTHAPLYGTRVASLSPLSSDTAHKLCWARERRRPNVKLEYQNTMRNLENALQLKDSMVANYMYFLRMHAASSKTPSHFLCYFPAPNFRFPYHLRNMSPSRFFVLIDCLLQFLLLPQLVDPTGGNLRPQR